MTELPRPVSVDRPSPDQLALFAMSAPTRITTMPFTVEDRA